MLLGETGEINKPLGGNWGDKQALRGDWGDKHAVRGNWGDKHALKWDGGDIHAVRGNWAAQQLAGQRNPCSVSTAHYIAVFTVKKAPKITCPDFIL